MCVGKSTGGDDYGWAEGIVLGGDYGEVVGGVVVVVVWGGER